MLECGMSVSIEEFALYTTWPILLNSRLNQPALFFDGIDC